jgi:hypothetical protein
MHRWICRKTCPNPRREGSARSSWRLCGKCDAHRRRSKIQRRSGRDLPGAETRGLRRRQLNRRVEWGHLLQHLHALGPKCSFRRRVPIAQWNRHPNHERDENVGNDPTGQSKRLSTTKVRVLPERHTGSGEISRSGKRSYPMAPEVVVRSACEGFLTSQSRAHFNHLRLANDAGDGLCVNAPMDSVISP